MLQSPEIRSFLVEIDSFMYKSHHRVYREVILSILKKLLEEPNTSSIAMRRWFVLTDPPKKGYNDYTLLARVPLWRHSVNVSKKYIYMHFDDGLYDAMTFFTGLIASMGHDYGKLMRLRPPNYQKNDHPIIGAKALQELIGREQVGEYIKTCILTAIEFHHRPFDVVHNNYARSIARRVAAADWAARQDELIQEKLKVHSNNASGN